MKQLLLKNLRFGLSLGCWMTILRAEEPKPHQTGSFRATFSETHPLSTREEFDRRKNPESYEAYRIQDESFQIHVPQTYREDRPHGLFVWISSGDGGNIPGAFRGHLADFNYIAVGANQSGNNRHVYTRKLLALDAVHNLKRFYNIDADRVVISGSSGGGRTASETAVAYPDVFTGGGYYVIGANYYGRLHFEELNSYLPARFKGKPPLYDLAKTRPFVFHTGSKDFNQEDTLRVYRHYVKDKFEQSLYIEDKGLGHSIPRADSILNGLIHLNKGLEEKSRKLLEDARPLLQQGRFAEAFELLSRSEVYGNATAKEWIDQMRAAADRELESAKALLEENQLLAAHAAFSGLEARFGPKVGRAARTARETLERDPALENEKIAANIFHGIQQRYSPDNPDPTIGFLEKLIEKYPETQAAIHAQAVLDRFQQPVMQMND